MNVFIFCISTCLLMFMHIRLICAPIKFTYLLTWYSAMMPVRTRFWYKVCIWRGTQQRGLTDKFLQKSWTKPGVNKLLRKLRDTGTVDRQPEIWTFNFPDFQGSVATCLRWGGYCRICFVANFIRFPALQKCRKSLKIWQSYKELKGGNFFWDTV